MQLGVERQNTGWSGGRGLQVTTKSRNKGEKRKQEEEESRGKANKKPCSSWACTTTTTEGWVSGLPSSFPVLRVVHFAWNSPLRRRPFTFTILICFEKCVLWRKPCKLQSLCPSCFSLQSHVHTYCNYQREMICLCVSCPRQGSHSASVKEKYFNGKHRTCESSNWKTLEERANLKA